MIHVVKQFLQDERLTMIQTLSTELRKEIEPCDICGTKEHLTECSGHELVADQENIYFLCKKCLRYLSVGY